MWCNVSKNQIKTKHKKEHKDLLRFNHNVQFTSSQDLFEVFFYYVKIPLQVGVGCPSAQLTFTQVILSKLHSNLQVVLSKLHSTLQVFFLQEKILKLSPSVWLL